MFAAVQELEEDPEMRSKVALYRDPAYNPALARQQREAAMTDTDEDDLPEIPLEDLLDEMSALQLEGQQRVSDEEDDMSHS